MKTNILLGFGMWFVSSLMYAQNVGIDQPVPTEKLEVSGKIYSNTGGFRFPDGTVQSTAALNAVMMDQSSPKLFMLLEIEGITGELDTMGLTGVSLVYDVDMHCGIDFSAGPGVPDLEEIVLTKEFDKATPLIMQQFLTQNAVGYVKISFYRDSPSPMLYMRVTMNQVLVVHHNLGGNYMGNGIYEHVEEVRLNCNQIQVEYLPESLTTCWNFVTNSPCIIPQ